MLDLYVIKPHVGVPAWPNRGLFNSALNSECIHFQNTWLSLFTLECHRSGLEKMGEGNTDLLHTTFPECTSVTQCL